MKRKIGITAVGLIGFIVVSLTVGSFFLLSIKSSAVNMWALFFLLFSEVTFFSGLIGVRLINDSYDKHFPMLGISIVLLLYFLTTLCINIFAGLLSNYLNTFILIHLFSLAFYLIVMISFFALSRFINYRDRKDGV